MGRFGDKKTEQFLARFLTYKFASECTNLMRKSKDDISDVALGYLYLATSALESYGKSYMCLQWEIRDQFGLEEMNERASTYKHDLHRIFHYQGVGEDFLKIAKIKNVSLKRQKKFGFDFDYFEFDTSSGSIHIYPLETLRYGVLTKKVNTMLRVEQNKLLELCDNVREAVLLETKKLLPSP